MALILINVEGLPKMRALVWERFNAGDYEGYYRMLDALFEGVFPLWMEAHYKGDRARAEEALAAKGEGKKSFERETALAYLLALREEVERDHALPSDFLVAVAIRQEQIARERGLKIKERAKTPEARAARTRVWLEGQKITVAYVSLEDLKANVRAWVKEREAALGAGA